MTLDDKTLRAAVLLTDNEDRFVDDDNPPLGTAFLVTIESAVEGRPHAYLVTAFHVICCEEAVFASIPNARTGHFYEAIEISDWRQPLKGVDLAIAPLNPGQGANYLGIQLETDFVPAGLSPQLGAEVFYLGYFQHAKQMVARSGTIAALRVHGVTEDATDLRVDHHIVDSVAHLIDCRSYAGFSGSACFVSSPIPVLEVSTKPIPTRKPLPTSRALGVTLYAQSFCGMFIAHFSDATKEVTKENLTRILSAYGTGHVIPPDEITKILEVLGNLEKVVSQYGMGVVLPSSEIERALNTDSKLIEERAARDRSLLGHESR